MSADGRQAQGSAEWLSKTAPVTNTKQEALLAKARARIAKIDVGSDRVHDEKEREIKEKALQFISIECLGLPEEQFFDLVKKMEVLLRKKDVEHATILAESKKALEEAKIDAERVGPGRFLWNKARDAFEAAANKYVNNHEDDAKGITKKAVDWIDKKSGANREMFRNEFRTDGYNMHQSATHLHYFMESDPNREKFRDELEKDGSLLIGFYRNWNDKHPIAKELRAMGLESVVKKVSEEWEILRKKYGFPQNPKNLNEGVVKTSLENKLAVENGGKKKEMIFNKGFSSNPDYAQSTANYAEYLVSPSGQGDRLRFVDELKADKKALFGLIENWGPNHSGRKVLEARKATEAIRFLDESRREIMREYGIPDPLPADFSKNKEGYLKKKEDFDANVKKIEKHNEEARKFLKDRWKRMRTAAESGDIERVKAEAKAVSDYFAPGKAYQSWETLIKNDPQFRGIPTENQPKALQDLRAIKEGGRFFERMLENQDDANNFVSYLASQYRVLGAAKSVALSDRIKSQLDAYEDAIFATLEGREKKVVVTSGENRFKSMDASEFRKVMVENKSDIRKINPEGFADYIHSLYLKFNPITPEGLSVEWGRENYGVLLANLAEHWGVGADSRGNASKAYNILLKRNEGSQAAVQFTKALKDGMGRILNENRLDKSGGYPALKQALLSKGVSEERFEAIKSRLDSGDSIAQFKALRSLPELQNMSYEDFLKLIEDLGNDKRLAANASRNKRQEIAQDSVFLMNAPGVRKFQQYLNECESCTIDAKKRSGYKKLSQAISNFHDKNAAMFFGTEEWRKLAKDMLVHIDECYENTKDPDIAKLKTFLISGKTERAARTDANAHKQTVKTETARIAGKSEAKATVAETGKIAEEAAVAARAKAERMEEARDKLSIVASTGNGSVDTGAGVVRADDLLDDDERFEKAYENIVKNGKLEKLAKEADQAVRGTSVRAPENTNEGSERENRPQASASILSQFQKLEGGAPLDIASSYTAVKTESGGLEVKIPTGKLRFDYREAEGAVQQIDILRSVGADFLIPSMKEIANASGLDYRLWVSRTEASNVLSTLAKTFGYESVLKETDPKAMLEKFRAHASGAIDGETIGAKARRMGVLKLGNLDVRALNDKIESTRDAEKRAVAV